MPDCLFVYGTLLPGLVPPPLQDVVARMESLGPATMRGRLYDLGPYPGAVIDAGESPAGRGASVEPTVAGLVYRLPADPDVLERLDAYEGHDTRDPRRSLFLRLEARAVLDDGRVVSCWVYQYNRDLTRAVRLVGGDYRRRPRT